MVNTTSTHQTGAFFERPLLPQIHPTHHPCNICKCPGDLLDVFFVSLMVGLVVCCSCTIPWWTASRRVRAMGCDTLCKLFRQIPKNDNHAGEWSGVFAISKFNSAAQKTNLHIWFLIDVVVEVCRISSGRNQQYDSCAGVVNLFCTLLNPVLDCSTIWRVAKDRLPFPCLRQPIVHFSKIAVAFVIGLVSAGIKGEVEFRIQLVKKFLWRFPIHGALGLCSCEIKK